MIGIIGAGGHAKVITEALCSSDPNRLVVFFSSDPVKSDAFFKRYPHYEDRIDQLSSFRSKIHAWHAAIGNIRVRKAKIDLLDQLQYKLIRAVHSSAVLSPTCKVENGTSIMAGCIINSDSRIGKGCIVNTSTSIDHDCNIGNFVNIGPGCRLAGGVTIGDETELGTGVTVIPNVTIGKNCIVGAGSVVIRDIPDGSRVAGVPAKPIK